MDIKSSLIGVFTFGALAIVLLFVAGLLADHPLVVLLAIAAMALSYLAQVTFTTAMLVEEQAYGPSVTADDDGTYGALIARASRFRHLGLWLWGAVVVVYVAGFILLAVA